jgi:hypothetical protein
MCSSSSSRGRRCGVGCLAAGAEPSQSHSTTARTSR